MTTTAPTQVAGSNRQRRKDRRAGKTLRENVPALLMITPAMLGLIAFLALPFIVAILLSFYNVQLDSVHPAKYVGFQQYRRLFSDPIVSKPFFRSLLNNLTFAVVVIPVQTGIALGLAMLLNRKLKGMGIFRTVFFMPVVFPMALVAVIWRLILDRSNNGLLNSVIHLVSAGHIGPHDWLGAQATAMASVILLSIWQGVGFQMVIILAGLQEIPVERYEAARIDRANFWQQFLHVTLPGLRNTLIFIVLLTTIFAFRVYDQVYILITTGGGNRNALQTVLYQATSSVFDQNNLGRAAAITVVFFIIVVSITIVQRVSLRQRSDS